MKHKPVYTINGCKVFKATEWLVEQVERIYGVKADKKGVEFILYEKDEDECSK